MTYKDFICRSSLNFNGQLVSLQQPLVMGILNVTTDSFFDGGKYNTEDHILQRVQQMLDEGANIVDVGAVSTRPGAMEISENHEITTIVETIKLLHLHFPDAILSVDTWRAAVAKEAVRNGAAMINDISGGTFDTNMIPLIGALQVPYILMHTPAKPVEMQQFTHYDNLLAEMLHFFDQQIDKLQHHFVHDIILDPGFGFGKTVEQNYFLLKNIDAFKIFNMPLLVGISRKSMVYSILRCTSQEALNGTTVLNTLALGQDVAILRVHDVKEAVQTQLLIQ